MMVGSMCDLRQRRISSLRSWCGLEKSKSGGVMCFKIPISYDECTMSEFELVVFISYFAMMEA